MGATPRRQRWHLVYFALGAFNVVSVGAAVALSHRILDVYRASIEDNRAWSRRGARYAELGALATEANGPGNDVFENRDVVSEEARLRAAIARFQSVHRAATSDLRTVDAHTAARLEPDLAAAGERMHAMAAEAHAIFAGFRANDVAGAGRHMATMDRELAATQHALDGLRVSVQAVQQASFTQQLGVARRVGGYASAIVGLVVLMVLFVVAYGLKLFGLFAKAQEAIERRNDDMRALLDNVSQGFVNVAPDGALSPERSAAFTQWFGPHREGAKLWDYLRPLDASAATWMELAWESIAEDVMPLEVCLDQLPKRVSVDGRSLALEYRPVLRDGALRSVLLVVSDVTAELARQRAEQRQRELLTVFERITSDQRGFLEFFDDAERIIARLSAANDAPLPQVKRDVHTLKGNAGFFGLASVVAVCHEVETRIADQGDYREADREALREAWEAVRDTLRFLVGDREALRVEIADEEYRELLTAVERGAAHGEIARRIRSWRLDPVRKRFARFADLARDLARRLGKGEVEVACDDRGIRAPEKRLGAFWSAFVHAVRNAVDHGLEGADDRVLAGKPERGRIWLRADVTSDRFVVEIEDDGRGIAWDRVAARAREAGRPCETREDLIEALFDERVSTADGVTEVSGRGIGSGAVRESCVALGGSVEVRSEPGRGTRFVFGFPRSVLDADDAAPAERAA